MDQEIEEREKDYKNASQEDDDINFVYVGIKPFMNYVTALVVQFKHKNRKEVIVCARGKFISKACDVVEVARRSLLKEDNINVKDIILYSEKFNNKEDKKEVWVSTIEITLTS